MIGIHDLPRIGSLGRHDARSSSTLPHPGSTLTYSSVTNRLTTNDAPQDRPPGCCRAACVGDMTHACLGWSGKSAGSEYDELKDDVRQPGSPGFAIEANLPRPRRGWTRANQLNS